MARCGGRLSRLSSVAPWATSWCRLLRLSDSSCQAPQAHPSARALVEYIFRGGKGREDTRPPRIERQVCERFCRFGLRQPMVHRSIQVIRQLCRLSRCDERADSHETPIAGRKIRAEPEVTEQHVRGVLDDPGCSRAE